MAKAPIKARIEPQIASVPPGLTQAFTFFVGDSATRAVKWSISDPAIGKMGGPFGEDFIAAPEPRISHAVITGTSLDGKYTATAQIHTEIGREIGEKFVLVDNWSGAAAFGIPWNTPTGRRAWLLMMDVIHQLPAVFLANIPDQICIVRAKQIFWKDSIGGVHWPFDRKAVILSERDISLLTPTAGITAHDRKFARTFLHEVCHVALANRAFGDGDRFWRSLAGSLSWLYIAGGFIPPVPVGFFVGPVGLLLGHVPGHANRDFLSDYADVTGWVTNGLQWAVLLAIVLTKQSPDVITGLKLIGSNPIVGLRNERLLEAIAKGESDPVSFVGMPSFSDNPGYASVDVHEDFAESLTYLALTKNWQKAHPKFKERGNFFINNKIWPKDHHIEVGGWINAWLNANPLSKPPVPANEAARSPMNLWAVYFGYYAGAPAKVPGQGNPNRPVHGKPASKKLRAFKTESIREPDEPGADEPFVQPDPGDQFDYLGSGGSEKSPWIDEINEQVERMPHYDKLAQIVSSYASDIAPDMAKLCEVWLGLPFPPRDGSLLELLRTAEVHGDGLSYCPPLAKGATATLTGVQPGEIIVMDNGNLWCVLETKDGQPVKATVASLPETDDGKLKAEDIWSVAKIRYRWQPSKKARRWFVPLKSTGPYEDLDAAMRAFVALWGLSLSPAQRDLSRSAALLAEVLDQAKVTPPETRRSAWWEDASIDNLQPICDAHGDGTRSLEDGEVQVGDVVRLEKPDRLGVVIRVDPDHPLLDVLVNGADDEPGVFGEPEGAAKLMHQVPTKRVLWFWRPAK